MGKLLLSLAVVAAAVSTLPATAQPWRLEPAVRSQIGADIQQLKEQIDRAAQRRTISFREASGLRRDALRMQRDYARFARDGLDRKEVTSLQADVNRVRQLLRLERRDWDGRRG